MWKQENSGRRDYCNYCWQKTEFILAVAKSIGVVIFLSYFFYRSFWAMIPLSVVGYFYFQHLEQRKKEREKEQLLLQFKECISSVSTALKAGYAAENAFLESRNDMKLLYGESSFLYQELELIRRGLVIHIPLEEQLMDFARRSDCEEIRQFAGVFGVAKKSGGDLPVILEDTVEMIRQNIEVSREIHISLSGKQMEQNIMKLMPFGILIYIGASSPGYFDMLYHNLQGAGIMTICLILYLAAYALGEKIWKDILNSL